MISLRIEAREAVRSLERMAEKLDPKTFALAAAGGAADAMRRHFEAKGGRHFWRRVADGVSVVPDGDGASVTMLEEHVRILDHKESGGRIYPRNAKRLKIPANGASPNATGTPVILGRRPDGHLVMALASGPLKSAHDRAMGAAPKIVAWLVPYADQDPEPGVWPDEADLLAGAEEAVREELEEAMADFG